jgi:putative intracellular protease/amidase
VASIIERIDLGGAVQCDGCSHSSGSTVPLLVEDTLSDRGGLFSKIEDWTSYVQKIGNLIAGQNPVSSTPVAKLVLKTLN